MSQKGAGVQVFVRVRPCEHPSEAFRVEPGGKAVQMRQEIKDASNKTTQVEYVSFEVNQALEVASQDRTFEVVGRPVVDQALDGYNGTILCYGQTGAGKSFTMVGSREDYNQRGLAARAIAYAFRESANRPEFEYKIRFSCLEIYNDEMHDLLSTLPSEASTRQSLMLSENRGRVEVKGLAAPEVENEQAALALLFTAEANRVVAHHQLNTVSSRSHVLYMLQIERRSHVANGALTVSKLTLVDLAGSERLKKSGGMGDATMQREAMAINKSLSFLEQVVVAVGNRKAHVPHRSSKLTAVLRESLGGNTKTVMVANVWPEVTQAEETLSTLRFAMRMKSITNLAVLNSHAEATPQQALAACQAQVHELKRELAMHDQLAGRGHVSYEPSSDAQKAELRGAVQAWCDGVGPEPEAATLRQVRHAHGPCGSCGPCGPCGPSPASKRGPSWPRSPCTLPAPPSPLKPSPLRPHRQVRDTYELFKQLYNEQAAKLREMEQRAVACEQRCAGMPSSPAGMSVTAEAAEKPPVEVSARALGCLLCFAFSPTLCPHSPTAGRLLAVLAMLMVLGLCSGQVVNMVGDVMAEDGGDGFGVGVAPPNAKPANPAFNALPLPPSNAEVSVGPTGGFSVALNMTPRGEEPTFSSAPGLEMEGRLFKAFKHGAGAVVNAQLNDNKQTLKERKAAVRQLGTQVNLAKREIDQTKVQLDRMRELNKPHAASNGSKPEVIDDEEFRLVGALKAAKQKWRFRRLRSARPAQLACPPSALWC